MGMPHVTDSTGVIKIPDLRIDCFKKGCLTILASIEADVIVHREVEDGYSFYADVDLVEVTSVDVYEVEMEGIILDESAHGAFAKWLMEGDIQTGPCAWINQAFNLHEIDMDSITEED